MRRILTLASLLFCLAACALPAFAQAPASIEAHTNGSNQITVAWSAVQNATGYNLYSSTTNGGPYTTLVTGSPFTTTTDTVTGLNDTVNEYFVVTAIVAGNESAQSQQASARSGTPQVAAPTSLAATASSGQVVLTWTVVTGETNYDIYRQPVSPSNSTYLYVGPVTPSVNGTTATYTDTSVVNGTAYTYAVAAVDGHGEGNMTGWVSGTPLAPPALMVEATAKSSTEIDLGWTASTGAASYTLLRAGRTGGETFYKGPLTNTYYTNTGLTSGSTFYYEVIAVAQDGSQSAPSGEVSATTGSAPLPAPTLSGSAIDGQVSLSWTSVSGAAYYDVYRVPNPNNDSTGFYTRVSSGTSYTDVNVSDGTAYSYQVAAGASSGQGTLSTPALTLTPLASPTVTATPTSTPSVSVSWTTVTGATSYQVQRETSTSGPWSVVTTTSGTSYPDPSVSFATDYYCVHALCTGTDSGPSNVALAETCPAAPTNLVATAGNAQVVLSWTEPAGDVGGVSVYKGTTPGGESSTYITHGVLGTTYTDTGLTNGQTYYYKISATDLGGASARSNEASATPTNVPPSAPTLTATAGNCLVTLSWTVPTGPVSSYTLYRGGAAIETGLTGTSWTDTGLTNGTPYTYTIQAINGAGASSNSAPASATPTNSNNGPAAVSGTMFVVQGDSHVILYWSPVQASGSLPAASSYNLYQSVAGSAFTRIQTNITTTANFVAGNLVTCYDGGLADGVPSTYYVTGVSIVGGTSVEGAASPPIIATPVLSLTPSAPAYPSADPGGSAGTAKILCNPDSAPAYRTLYRSTTSGQEQSSLPVLACQFYEGPTRQSLQDSNLVTGTMYYYKIVSAVSAGSVGNTVYYTEGPASSEVSFTPGAALLGAPQNLSAVSKNFATQVSWQSDPQATSYNVYCLVNPLGGSQATIVVNTTQPTAKITSLPYGGNPASYITFAVASVAASGEGSESSFVSCTLQGFGLQPVPASLMIACGQRGVVTIGTPAANNFVGPIAWSVSGAPTGVTAWLDSPSTTATYSDIFGSNHTGSGSYPTYPANYSEGSTLFVWVAPNTPIGTYSLQVTGTAGATASYVFTQTLTIPLTVTAGSSAVPRRRPIYLARALVRRQRRQSTPVSSRVSTHGYGG